MMSAPQIACTSEMGRLMADGIERVIGQTGAQAVNRLAGLSSGGAAGSLELPSVELAALQVALEEVYGTRGGRGIALRAGRAIFASLRHAHEGALGWDQVKFRLQPAPLRLTNGFISLAGLLGELTGTEFAVTQGEDRWQMQAPQCPFCWQRETDDPACPFWVGLVQEYFLFASSGKFHSVSEVECRAAGGDACIIQVENPSLD